MEDIWAIVAGIATGTVVRLMLLKVDYRAYPSAPNGVLIHATVGFVAASLGAVAVPALLKRDYVAVTFLVLAIQQLREVRRSERESLTDLERTEFVPRGEAYIDGLAKGFESRNYVTLLVALVTTSASFLIPGSIWIGIVGGVAAGFILFQIIHRMTGHRTVGELAKVEQVPLDFKGGDLYVGDIFVTNIGLETQRKRIEEGGLGFVITPEDHAAQVTFNNYGLRQAIIHEISRIVGVKRFYQTRRDFDTGQVALYLIPMKKDPETIIEVIKRVPLIESVRREEDLASKNRSHAHE